jgi:hypothetical protein
VPVPRWISNLNSQDRDFSSVCLTTFTFLLVIAANGYLVGHRAGSSKAESGPGIILKVLSGLISAPLALQEDVRRPFQGPAENDCSFASR